MGCRIAIRPVQYAGLSKRPKYRLYDIVDNRFLENKSGTAPLEYGSERAACRGHDKHCQHETLPQIDGSEKARDNAADVLREINLNDCDYCGEGSSLDDPLAEWITLNNLQMLAHGQCGEDAGWRLA